MTSHDELFAFYDVCRQNGDEVVVDETAGTVRARQLKLPADCQNIPAGVVALIVDDSLMGLGVQRLGRVFVSADRIAMPALDPREGRRPLLLAKTSLRLKICSTLAAGADYVGYSRRVFRAHEQPSIEGCRIWAVHFPYSEQADSRVLACTADNRHWCQHDSALSAVDTCLCRSLESLGASVLVEAALRRGVVTLWEFSVIASACTDGIRDWLVKHHWSPETRQLPLKDVLLALRTDLRAVCGGRDQCTDEELSVLAAVERFVQACSGWLKE